MFEGIYDRLITTQLRAELESLDGSQWKALREEIDDADGSGYFVRHLAARIKVALDALPREQQQQRQIALANALLKVTADQDGVGDEILDPAEVLKAVYRGPAAPLPPVFPLAASSLILNLRNEPKLGNELYKELMTADRVLMLVSFIQWRGWQRLKPAFQELCATGRPVRVLTTTYIGASDLNALREMVELPNLELKISLDGRRRRLHAKAWMFERRSGYSTAYVGSANLSGPALEDGIEWTVKLSEVETPHLLTKFRGAFDSLWADEEFECYRAGDTEFEGRIAQALESAKHGAKSASMGGAFFAFAFDLKPHPYQQATLDQLLAERLDRGHWRNLVVAPTGTGKTMLAAFDYKRQHAPGGVRPRLLFLAHREELLAQARDVFRHVLRDENFGELLAGNQVASYHYLFATVQSFQSRRLWEAVPAQYWEFVVLDEAHHGTAESYREAVQVLRPRILLGLTATPERMDGQSILPWFDNRIADEMRLWHAIERQYLAPFDYYGIHDGTDLSAVSWSRGAYRVSELSALYTAGPASARRAAVVLENFLTIYGDIRKARAIGFCVSIAHAEFMAEYFSQAGVSCLSVTSATREEERQGALGRLRRGELQVLFTVDLLNEGIDIPEVDCLLFMRPTESATIFMQQLGRGLRLHEGKMNCLVLDFIGNHRSEFRFDLRLSALLGGTRRQAREQAISGIFALPGNCYFHLDKESQRVVLERLKTQLSDSRGRVVQELQRLRDILGRVPRLSEFLRESQYDLNAVYKNGCSWSLLLRDAGLLEGSLTESGAHTAGQFARLLHVDSVSRLRWYQAIVSGDENSGENSMESAIPSGSELARRSALMLTLRLLQGRAKDAADEWAAIHQIRADHAVSEEFLQLCDCLLDRIATHVEEQAWKQDQPLYLHRSYMRDEILAAVGFKTLRSKAQMREGVLWLPNLRTEVLFVTLDKSEKHFSPTTRYEDFAISPTRFHWQSQSTTSESSERGMRYRLQVENGVEFLLFVRGDRSRPYVFLGPVHYVSHTGTRPMSIEWELSYPMPAWFFEICASLRVA